MRLPATILALVAVAACASPFDIIKTSGDSSVSVQTVPEPVARALRNVWSIAVLRSTESESGGVKLISYQEFKATAFPVQHLDGELVLMTAAHAVRQEKPEGELVKIAAVLNGKIKECRLVQVHDEQDAALIALPDPDSQFETLSIERRIPKFGEVVYAAGYPAGMGRLFITSGIVSDPDLNSTLNYPGSSGSPVVDSLGQVVAMMVRIGTDDGTIITHTTFTVLMAHL